ncbi:MAG: hypothetical protein Q9195_007804 [Heterodermia aff. obscurata]
MECVYSVSNRVGRPRGIKNKKTLDRLGKATADSRPQTEGNNTGSVEEDSMPESNDALHDVFNPARMPPELSELQPRMGVNQPGGPALASAPANVGLTPEIDALNLSLHANDAPLLPMVDSTAPWPTFRELADFSTSENVVPTYDYTARSPPPMLDPASWDLAAFAQSQSVSFASHFHQMTPPASSTVSSDCSGGLRPDPRGLDTASTSRARPMQDPTPRLFRSVGARGSSSMMPPPLSSGLAWPKKTAEEAPPCCNCLERHAGLLLRLKELEAQQQPQPRIDVLLVFAKNGIEAWQSLIDCSTCQENEDEEALQLAAMCIRVFVRSLRRLSRSDEHNFDCYYGSTHSNNNTLLRNDSTNRSRGKNANQTGGSETPHDSRQKTAHHHHHRRSWAAAAATDPSTTAPSSSGARTKLGMFEITGSDRAVVGKVMLSRTLQQIQIVLVGLKQRASRGFEPAHRMLSDAAAELLEDVEDEEEEAEGEGEGNAGYFVLGFLNSLEAMVLALRRDIHQDLNPALDGGGGTAYN